MASNSILDKLTPKQRIGLAVAVLAVAGIVMLVQQFQKKPAPAPQGEPGTTLANRHIRFGMPADAKADPAHKDAYLLERPQYALSYNDSKKTPNWVCWHLKTGDLGKTKRENNFAEDPELPSGFRRIKHGDYTGGGFDRGHLCPAADRSDSPENSTATFYMTNMMPQSAECNRGGWERFESHCRDLTKDGSELYIAAGPHGQGGTGTEGFKQTIGRTTQITVPAACWKVALILPKGENTVGTGAKALAVWMPNDTSVPEAWKPYAVSVAEVEKRTGYKFFPLVPDDIAAPLKGQVTP